MKQTKGSKMATKKKPATKKLQLVVVRTYSAGVHIGEVVAKTSTTIELKNARRLHRWKGANTLSEVALHGVDTEYSRLSEPVGVELQWIEIIPVAPKATINLTTSRWPS